MLLSFLEVEIAGLVLNITKRSKQTQEQISRHSAVRHGFATLHGLIFSYGSYQQPHCLISLLFSHFKVKIIQLLPCSDLLDVLIEIIKMASDYFSLAHALKCLYFPSSTVLLEMQPKLN